MGGQKCWSIVVISFNCFLRVDVHHEWMLSDSWQNKTAITNVGRWFVCISAFQLIWPVRSILERISTTNKSQYFITLGHVFINILVCFECSHDLISPSAPKRIRPPVQQTSQRNKRRTRKQYMTKSGYLGTGQYLMSILCNTVLPQSQVERSTCDSVR